MNCPQCARPAHVVCSKPSCTCYKRVPTGELPLIVDHENDTEQCPYCGFTAHVDTWEEIDMKQLDRETK